MHRTLCCAIKTVSTMAELFGIFFFKTSIKTVLFETRQTHGKYN